MIWTDFVTNPQAVQRLYRHPPSLADVELFNIEINRDGPVIRLTIGVDGFPENPSPRWMRGEANAVTLELLLVGIEELRLEGWATTNRTEIKIERISSDLLQVTAAGPTCELRCRCAYIPRRQGFTLSQKCAPAERVMKYRLCEGI